MFKEFQVKRNNEIYILNMNVEVTLHPKQSRSV